MSDGVIVALISAGSAVVVALIGLLVHYVTKNGTNLPPGPKAFELSGRWHGEQKQDGWGYDCTIHLQVVQSQIMGHINWTLIQLPLDRKYGNKVGETVVEYVKGFLEQNRITMSGYQVDNPRKMSPADYLLTIHEDLKTFDGTTKEKSDGAGGSLHGHAVVTR